MGDFSFEQLLASECRGEVDAGKVKEMLGEFSDGVEKYNQQILDVLSGDQDCLLEKKILKLNDLLDDKIIQEVQNYTQKEPKDEFRQEVKNNLSRFYSIKLCPSYLYHKKVLAKEDYEFFLEIYSDFYSFKKNNLKDVAKSLQDIMEDYIKNVLEQCTPEMSVEEAREKFEC